MTKRPTYLYCEETDQYVHKIEDGMLGNKIPFTDVTVANTAKNALDVSQYNFIKKLLIIEKVNEASRRSGHNLVFRFKQI